MSSRGIRSLKTRPTGYRKSLKGRSGSLQGRASGECILMVYHLPALILAVILTAYWGRVVRLVYKMRRRHGARANCAPPERRGRWLRSGGMPAVLIWVAPPWLTALTKPENLPAPLRELWTNRAVAYAAAAIADDPEPSPQALGRSEVGAGA